MTRVVTSLSPCMAVPALGQRTQGSSSLPSYRSADHTLEHQGHRLGLSHRSAHMSHYRRQAKAPRALRCTADLATRMLRESTLVSQCRCDAKAPGSLTRIPGPPDLSLARSVTSRVRGTTVSAGCLGPCPALSLLAVAPALRALGGLSCGHCGTRLAPCALPLPSSSRVSYHPEGFYTGARSPGREENCSAGGGGVTRKPIFPTQPLLGRRDGRGGSGRGCPTCRAGGGGGQPNIYGSK